MKEEKGIRTREGMEKKERQGKPAPGHRPLHGKVRDDQSIALVLAPPLEEFAAGTRHHGGGRGEDDAGALPIVELGGPIEEADMVEEERIAEL